MTLINQLIRVQVSKLEHAPTDGMIRFVVLVYFESTSLPATQLQIIICENGAAGINFEHSGVDGHTVLR